MSGRLISQPVHSCLTFDGQLEIEALQYFGFFSKLFCPLAQWEEVLSVDSKRNALACQWDDPLPLIVSSLKVNNNCFALSYAFFTALFPPT